jgi:glycosyltransferase involved in cell wall biosynthesis
MKKPVTISVAIATYNEAEFIGQCLDSVVSWVDQVIVVDGHSSDSTVNIVKKYPKVKIISTTNKPNFHINKQMAIDACTSDWILQLDADEIISSGLALEIKSAINNASLTENGYWLNRANFFLGKFLKKGGQYPDPTLRLYRRGFGHLPCKSVHEQAVVRGSTGHLKNDLLHYADRSFKRYLIRHQRYTNLIAQELFDQKVKLSLSNIFKYLFIKPCYWFLLTYFRHKGFLDGLPGFVFSFFSALRFPIAFIKLYEKYQNRH